MGARRRLKPKATVAGRHGLLISTSRRIQREDHRSGCFSCIHSLPRHCLFMRSGRRRARRLFASCWSLAIRISSQLTWNLYESSSNYKRSLEETIPQSTRVLRSQSAMPVEDVVEDMPTEQMEQEELNLDDQLKKKNGRKRTRMHNVYDRANQPPVRVDYNAEGQPVGNNATEFSNFLSTIVKSQIPFQHEDWRNVDVTKKNDLMTILRKYYIVDEKLKDWVMGSAHKKWRDFKSNLKALHFDESKTDEELLAARDDRVSIDDWEWLIEHWRGEEAKHKENGYAPRRDELFIRTHTSKDGTPGSKEAAKIIQEIEHTWNDRPELLEKTIEQGDILSHVLGKEKNGYVRSIGLGPSAGVLGVPGAKKLKSTKLQMAEEEIKEAWRANALLREHVEEIQHDTSAKLAALMEEVDQLKRMMSQSIAGNNNEENIGVDVGGSVGESATAEDFNVNIQEKEDAVLRELKEAEALFQKKKEEAAVLGKKKEAALIQNKEAALRQKKKEAELLQKNKEAEHLQKNKEEEFLQKKKGTELQRKKEATVTQKNQQQGKEVILYNIYRDHSSPVAKATILSIDRKKMVGGRELGAEYCEVVINYIIKRDVVLPRGIGNVTTMGQAQGRYIAWPYKHLKVDHKSTTRLVSPPQAG